MSERRPILLLANPASGDKLGGPRQGRARRRDAADDLLADLRGRGLVVELHLLAPDDDAARLAAMAASDGRDVVVAGGDGTVGPVAAALAHSEAALGILPLGSWNNFATSAGLPAAVDEALDRVAAGRIHAIDVGLAWHPAADGPSGDPPDDADRFLEAAGVGVDAEWFGAAQVADRYGLLRALRTAWRVVRRRHAPMRLETDERAFEADAPAAIVCNGPYLGMGFAIAPDADVSDGMLNLVVFDRMGRWAVLRHLLAVARRRPRSAPRSISLRARRVTIRGTSRTLAAHADGRSIGTTPVIFAVDRGALRLFR